AGVRAFLGRCSHRGFQMTLREAERRQRQRNTSHRKQRQSRPQKEAGRNWRVAGLSPPMGDNAPPVEHRDRVLSFAQWCGLNGFSKATGRRLINRGEGPSVLQLSARRIGIKESANATWQASRAR